MSIVRVGLAETRNFAEGWDTIFGGKKPKGTKSPKTSANKKTAKKSKKKK